VIQQNGTPAYVRDGRVYEGGIFGGDIVEAVRGNPEAEAHAHAYKNGMIGGFLATVAGGVSMISGLTLFALGSTNSLGNDHNPTEQTAGGLLLAGGLGAYVTGLVLMLNAQPRVWDAINVYNDGIPMGPVPYGYLPPPPGYPYPPPPGLNPLPAPRPPATPAPAQSTAPASPPPAR
jgi:hypothetical protein